MRQPHDTPPIALRASALAVVAGFALAACGPREPAGDAFAGGSPPAATTVAPTATDAQPAPLAGTPVPTAAVSPAPAYAPPPPVVAQPAPLPSRSAPPVTAPPTRIAQAAPPRMQEAPVERRVVEHAQPGSVESIVPIHQQQPTTGAGAVIGGVIGGVLGNQFGHGKGRVATTGLGAVGGAVAGHEIEKRRNDDVVGYRVAVRLDNGTIRTFQRDQVGDLRVGDRVRVDGGGFHRG